MVQPGRKAGRIAMLGAISLIVLLFMQTLLAELGTGNGTYSRAADQGSLARADLAPGDIERGRELFMGNLHFARGGAPCMGCHNVASNGVLGGGAMGPDLTNVSRRRSSAELAAILLDPGPVMQPVYANHPLIDQERADLLAFITASAGEPEINKEGLVFGASLVGLAAAIGALAFVFRHRLHGVRRPMVAGARSGKLSRGR